MGLYFFLGVLIYLLILVTLMVWFLKYRGDNDQNNPRTTEREIESKSGAEANESGRKPNQILMDSMRSGGQSGSEKSEVLPGYCSQPNNLKIL